MWLQQPQRPAWHVQYAATTEQADSRITMVTLYKQSSLIEGKTLAATQTKSDRLGMG